MFSDHERFIFRHSPDLYLCEIDVGDHLQIPCDTTEVSLLNGKFIETMKGTSVVLIAYAYIDQENAVLIYYDDDKLEIWKVIQSEKYRREVFRTSVDRDVGNILMNTKENIAYADGALVLNNLQIPVANCNIQPKPFDVCLQCNALPDPDCSFDNGKCKKKTPHAMKRYSDCNQNHITKSTIDQNIYIISTPTIDKPQFETHHWLDSDGKILPMSAKFEDRFVLLLNTQFENEKVTLRLTSSNPTLEVVNVEFLVGQRDLFIPLNKADQSICNIDSRLAQCESYLDEAATLKSNVQEALHSCGNELKAFRKTFDAKVEEYQNQFDKQSQNVIESQTNYQSLEVTNGGLASQIAELKAQITELEGQVSNCDAHIVKYQQKIQDVQRERENIYCADPLLFFSGYIAATLIIFIICLIKFIRFQLKNRSKKTKHSGHNCHSNMEKIEIRNESTNATSTRSISPKFNSAGLQTPSPTPRRVNSKKTTPQITPRSEEEEALMPIESPTDSKPDCSIQHNDKIIL